jgi:uncharacterized protein
MDNFLSLFKVSKPVIGMVHLGALPGSPKYQGNLPELISAAIKEAKILKEGNIDGILIENMHDIPYLNKAYQPEVLSVMSIVAWEVKKITGLPTGIQILAGANKEALAAAHAAGADFIRAEGFIFGQISDEGYMDACAGELLRYRKCIGADKVKIITDIKKKHTSNAITADINIDIAVKSAEFFLSDGIIITGGFTGREPDMEDIRKIKETVHLPAIAGSGISLSNIETFYRFSDAFIIGSAIKEDNDWKKPVSKEKVRKLMNIMHSLRK